MQMNDYQAKAMVTAIYSPDFKVVYPALGLAGETGEVLEKVKKMLRDDNGVLTEERRELLKRELGDVLWYLTSLAQDLGFTLEDVAQGNIDKLTDRARRGVVQGNGDVR